MTAKELLNAMIAAYAEGCSPWREHTLQRVGQAEMLIRAAMLVYELSHDHATEFVGDRVADIIVNRD